MVLFEWLLNNLLHWRGIKSTNSGFDPEQLHDGVPRRYELMSLLPSITYSQLSSRSKSQ